ncbi:uncharacterized protein LOC135468346 [Liolophura sinensis]|uniref:uncharacterized protein LOC135468346 n=1 Tax=Liolophura sinensis TaxID=3198878 RepID=UPI00315858E6
MGRKGRVLKTYGRHRQRVVTAEEDWSAKRNHCNVFSVSGSSDHIFSSSGSLSKLSLSDSSSFDGTHTSKKKNGKENKTTRSKQLSSKATQQNSSSEKKSTNMRKERNCKRQALKEIRNGLLIENSVDVQRKKTRRNVRAVKSFKTINSLTENSQNNMSKLLLQETDTRCKKPKESMNFSEFEDYSLILSDSLVVDKNISIDVQNELKRAHSTPATQGRCQKKSRSGVSIGTSTPFCCSAKEGACIRGLSGDELSHIESSKNTSEFDNVFGISKADDMNNIEDNEIRSKLSLCSASLQQLCQSHSMSNVSSPQHESRVSNLSVSKPYSRCTRSQSLSSHSGRKAGIHPCSVPLSPLKQSMLHLKNYVVSAELVEDKIDVGRKVSLLSMNTFDNSDSLFDDMHKSLRTSHRGVFAQSDNFDSSICASGGEEDEFEIVSSDDSDSSTQEEDDPDFSVYTEVSSEDEDQLSYIAEGLEDLSMEHNTADGEHMETNNQKARNSPCHMEDVRVDRDNSNEDNDKGDEDNNPDDEDGVVHPDHGSYSEAGEGYDNGLNFSNSCYSLTGFGKSHDWTTDLSDDLSEASRESEEADVYRTAGSEVSRMLSREEGDLTASFHTPDKSIASIPHLSKRRSNTRLAQMDPQCDFQKSFSEMLTPRKNDCQKLLCPRSKVLLQCGQDDVIPFSAYFTETVMESCVKIGEGVYGEVFRALTPEPVAFKVIPIEGDFSVNDEAQKTFEEILPEIVISRELSALRDDALNQTDNFVTVQRVSCVQGKYPELLLQLWDEYNNNKESENERPDMFEESQLFIVFEFADGGCDLESFKFKNILEVRSVIQQVAYSLAVAEMELEFEHRDLHWGNVLVRRTTEKTLDYSLENSVHSVTTHGIHVTIIDFTLSRLTKDGCTVFCDLSKDETLFEGRGDYQFDIYRLMKDSNGNSWETFCPYTNILWLHYLLDKLTNQKTCTVRSKAHKNIQKNLKETKKILLDYQSAHDLVITNGLFDS